MGWLVVLAGVAEQAPAGGREADCVDVVLQDAVLHVWKGAVAQRLLQEEANQWGLEGLIAQFAQGLQDASDPQVVVLRPLKIRTGEALQEEDVSDQILISSQCGHWRHKLMPGVNRVFIF